MHVACCTRFFSELGLGNEATLPGRSSALGCGLDTLRVASARGRRRALRSTGRQSMGSAGPLSWPGGSGGRRPVTHAECVRRRVGPAAASLRVGGATPGFYSLGRGSFDCRCSSLRNSPALGSNCRHGRARRWTASVLVSVDQAMGPIARHSVPDVLQRGGSQRRAPAWTGWDQSLDVSSPGESGGFAGWVQHG